MAAQAIRASSICAISFQGPGAEQEPREPAPAAPRVVGRIRRSLVERLDDRSDTRRQRVADPPGEVQLRARVGLGEDAVPAVAEQVSGGRRG
jgi:hypothetical protein